MTRDADGHSERADGHRDPSAHDPVASNRSAPRRGAPPGRAQTGWHVTRRWFWVTAGVVIAATVALVLALASAG